LRLFSDEVHRRGLFFTIHTLGGGYGLHDPDYVTPRPDRRLESWGGGSLAGAAAADAKRLEFRPAPGVRRPTPRRDNTCPGLTHWLGADLLRIEDELVRVGGWQQTDQAVWVLTDVKRGQCGTAAVAHPAGAEAAGLVTAYDQVVSPGVDTSLMTETASAFAAFMNRNRVDHVEYDGAEDHTYEGDWGFDKFSTLVYQQLDHPVISHTSNGRPPKCHFEYRFNASQALMRGTDAAAHGSYNVPIVLDGWNKRPASNLLEANFVMSLGAIDGGTALGIGKPFPMFGVTPADLRAHGLTAQFLTLLDQWRRASRQMTEAQRQQMRATLVPRPHENHPGSAVVHELRRGAEGWEIYPMRVLTRATGDILWHREQENGAFGPKQTLTAGERIDVANPNAAQPPRVILRVLSGRLIDPVVQIGENRLSLTGAAAAGQYVVWDGGSTAQVSSANWVSAGELKAAAAGFVSPHGPQSITVTSGDAAARLELQVVTAGEPIRVPYGTETP